MRLFVAVDLPEELKNRLGKLIAELKRLEILDANFAKPQQLHLTLKFLGETSEAKAADIREVLKAIASNTKKFPVSLKGIGHFGQRVLWIGGISQELVKLAGKIDLAASKLGFEKEIREYAIHLTLARIKSIKSKEKFGEFLEKYSSAEFGIFDTKDIKLMRSTLSREGAIYEVVEEFSFRS
jgi:2'-5' RNA ligase